MTREKAIECLNYQNETFFGGQSEALKMAISALSSPTLENKADFPQAKDIEPTVKNFSKVLDNKLIRDAISEEICCFCGGVKRFGICQDCGSDI